MALGQNIEASPGWPGVEVYIHILMISEPKLTDGLTQLFHVAIKEKGTESWGTLHEELSALWGGPDKKHKS